MKKEMTPQQIEIAGRVRRVRRTWLRQLLLVLNLPNVVGGMLLPLVLILMILLCNDRRLMGRYVNGHINNVVAWVTTGVMTVLTLLIILSTLFPTLFGGS